jgi:hypothetical protein
MPRQDLPERKFDPTSILSYAQDAEDVFLSRAFADPEFGFYADIGGAPSRAIRNCEHRGTALDVSLRSPYRECLTYVSPFPLDPMRIK